MNRNLILAAILVSLCAAALMSGSSWSGLAAAAASTPTPTSTPTPIADPLLGPLRTQVYFFIGGAGGVPLAARCRRIAEKYSGPLPAIFIGDWAFFRHQIRTLCIYGLDMKGELKIDITDRKERKVGSGTFVINGTRKDLADYPGWRLDQVKPVRIAEAGEMVELPEGTLIQLDLWLPPDIADDYWLVRAKSGQAAKGKIDATWPDNRPVIYIKHQRADPFTRPEAVYIDNDVLPGAWYKLSSGQSLHLIGKGFHANRKIPLAFYLDSSQEDEYFKLIRAQIVQTDAQGAFKLRLEFKPDDPPGLYLLLALIDNSKPVPWIQDMGPWLYATWQP